MRRQAGFTLIETLVALAIAAVALIALMGRLGASADVQRTLAMQAIAVDDDVSPVHFDVTGEDAVIAVILEQVRVRVDVTQVVDGNQIEVTWVVLKECLGDLPADATETVDCNSCGHLKSPIGFGA